MRVIRRVAIPKVYIVCQIMNWTPHYFSVSKLFSVLKQFFIELIF